MFITGLEFLPVTSDLISVTSNAEAAVISVSVDNRVCIHTLYHRRECFLHVILSKFFYFVDSCKLTPTFLPIFFCRFHTVVACHSSHCDNFVFHLCVVQYCWTMIKDNNSRRDYESRSHITRTLFGNFVIKNPLLAVFQLLRFSLLLILILQLSLPCRIIIIIIFLLQEFLIKHQILFFFS